MIRGKGGNRDNPDSVQFRTSLRQVMVDSVLLTNPKQNCKDDVDNLLFTFRASSNVCETVFTQPAAENEDLQTALSNLCIVLPESGLSLVEGNIVTYISGFICKRIQTKLCKPCQENIIGTIQPDNKQHSFLSAKNYVNATHGLTVPSDDIVQLCSNIEKQYGKITYDIFHLDRVRSRIVTAIRNTVVFCWFV